jgi:PIN domain nuclease of toxin-antitoxin system
MNKAVLDSSALLSFINHEHGAEIVAEYIDGAVMSSINLAEVIAVLSLVDIPEETIANIVNDLNIEIIGFDQEQALQTGFLRKNTKIPGISLGDCACINLANIKNLPIITADKIWSKLDLTINVILIR